VSLYRCLYISAIIGCLYIRVIILNIIILSDIGLYVVLLTVVLQSIARLSVTKLNVVLLNVVAPHLLIKSKSLTHGSNQILATSDDALKRSTMKLE
jgi:hypothetical protein